MNLRTRSRLPCSRLQELRDALQRGHWPAACDPALRAHVDLCPRCTQELLLTTHIQHARNESLAAAHTTPPSLIWWRAQARRREAALQRAARPLIVAQAFALLTVVAVIAGIVALHWHSIVDRATESSPATLFSALLNAWGLMPIMVGVAAVTILTTVALYLATDRR